MAGGRRIHVLGASGAGTSTLGRALATALSSQAFDTDDFYWLPTEPPFTDKRSPRKRLELMQAMFLPRNDWVLSGSFCGWGDPVIPRLTHVVFATLPPAQRLARLRARERRRYGAEAIGPGGAREGAYRSFLDWAMQYDDPHFTGRSRRMHQLWLEEMPCPVLHLEVTRPIDALTKEVTDWLDALDGGGAGG